MLNRRQLLLGGAAALVAAGGAYRYGLRHSGPGDEELGTLPRLRFPPLLDARANGTFELTAMPGTHQMPGIGAAATAGFNQAYLGPVIRLGAGHFRGSVRNTLGEDITVHWHGLLIPGDQDGGPHQPVPPGATWNVDLEISQPPATLWYHSHSHRRTGIQVYHGLAGMLQIVDGLDDERGVPNSHGIDDLPLVIQDRRLAADGTMPYELGMMDLMHGMTGDTILVNGQAGSVVAVPKGIVRLRLLNGSNARIYDLEADDNRPLHLIATDGGLLPAPVELSHLLLSPGERAEVLVDFSDGRPMTLFSKQDPNQGPGGMMGRFRGVLDQVWDQSFPVLSAIVDETLPVRFGRLPDNLGGTPATSPSPNARRRSFELNMGMGMMGGGPSFGINGKPFDLGRLDFTVPLGSTEIWSVSSDMLSHPFHIHGTRFQVLSENGGRPRPEYRGWKDTVLVTGRCEIQVTFARPASPDAPYMYHCHVLEHEDAGMMGQFAVR
ncbi:multicopper oxidase domain-containing protein [Roseibium sp. Sym1]|uniref:multicopper oxidase domain-containing protein n=1 Tax=Roseibium sp. Sym1 TaxID=3016006 RepID=UPI003FA6D96F